METPLSCIRTGSMRLCLINSIGLSKGKHGLFWPIIKLAKLVYTTPFRC